MPGSFGYADIVRTWNTCQSIGCLLNVPMANFWQEYLWWFVENLQSFVYFDAITDEVLRWSFALFLLFMFLFFFVGFLFFYRK